MRTNARDVPKNVKGGSGSNWVEYEITKRGLNRANTIAVYSNGTVFNGHYNDYDSMHIFQINITETISSGLAFVGGDSKEPGINYLLIPNSVFINTVLNSIIQDDDRLGNSFLANGEFVSLDRDNLPATSSNNIEALFMITCTYAQALQILNWTQWGVINETSKELGIVNNYSSAEEHNCRAEMMNLHPEILDLIITIQKYKDDSQGSMPLDAEEWWAAVAKAIANFFIDLLTAIIDAIVAIIKAIVAAILFLIMLIIKAALLVHIFLMWGVGLLISTMAMAALAGIVLAIVGIGESAKMVQAYVNESTYVPWDFEIIYHIVYLYIKWGGVFEIEMSLESPWEYDNFLGFDIPTLECNVDLLIPDWSVDISMKTKYKYTGIEVEVEGIPEENMWGNDTDPIIQILDITGGVMTLSGSTFGIIGGILALSEPISGAIALGVGIVGFVGTVVTFFTVAISDIIENQAFEQLYWGLGFGLLISGILIFNPPGFLNKVFDFLGRNILKYGLYSISDFLLQILDTVGAFFPTTIVQSTLSLISGVIASVAGALAISAVANEAYKKIAQIGLGIICLGLSAYFLAQAFVTSLEPD